MRPRSRAPLSVGRSAGVEQGLRTLPNLVIPKILVEGKAIT